MADIRQIRTSEDIDRALSAEKALIFKHSTRCGVSARANEVVQAYAQNCDDSIDLYQVLVVEQRQLSNEISERTNVEHHSPEVIYIKNGAVSGFTTHFNIRQETIDDAFE